jgi:hypothetical protein
MGRLGKRNVDAVLGRAGATTSCGWDDVAQHTAVRVQGAGSGSVQVLG